MKFLCCFSIPLLIFCFHSYDFKIKFAGTASPDAIKFFYTYPFSEHGSVVVSGNEKNFSVSTFKQISRFRIDIDNPGHSFYDLEEVKINNTRFTGRELYKFIQGSNYLRAELIGNYCRLHLNFGNSFNSPHQNNYPDLDYHISFKIPKRFRYTDCFSTFFFVKILLYITFSLSLFFFNKKICFLLKTAYCFVRKESYIFPILQTGVKFLCCFSIPLLIFCFHSYDFKIKFAGTASPDAIKVFYTYPFSEHGSVVVSGNEKNFSVSTFKQISRFRIDIDNPGHSFYDLEEVQINNTRFTGRELYKFIQGSNYLRAELIGNYCRLHFNFGNSFNSPHQNNYPDLDYHISFKIPKRFRYTDCFSTFFFVKILLYITFSLSLFFFNKKICFLLKTAYHFGRKESYIFPILLICALLFSFLSLRQCLYNWPADARYDALLHSDIAVGMIIIGIFMLYALVRRVYMLLAAVIFLTLLYCLYFADCFTVFQFNTRLNLREAIRWLQDLKGTSSFGFQALHTPFAIWEFLTVIFSTVLLLLLKAMKKQHKKIFLVSCTILLLSGFVYRHLPRDRHIFEQDFANLFSYAYAQTLYVPYSESYLKSVTPFKLQYTKTQGKNLQRNVILLVVESLSAYQSKLFSGLPFDNLKNFDRLIKEKNADYSPCYLASAHNTTANTFALLTGFTQIVVPVYNVDYGNKKFYGRCLPAQLKKEGYKTSFFSSSSLVDSLGKVISEAGFHHTYDHTEPFYNGNPRYIFNSVHDDVLFDRLIKFVKDSRDEKFFAYAMTISMHGPYIDPRSKKVSYDETVKTFDINFSNFMKNLERTGFFNNGGLLFVTGDHRVMSTISAQEAHKMQFFTPQYVPLAIFGDIPCKINRKKFFSHTDLHYSLQYLLMKSPEKHQYQRNIFSSAPDREFFCSFYQQLVNPSIILFNTPDKTGKIRLNGDNSKIICPGLTDKERKKIESFLVWMRTR